MECPILQHFLQHFWATSCCSTRNILAGWEQALLCSHGERTHTGLQHPLKNSQISGLGAAECFSWAECTRSWRITGWDGCFLSSSLAPRGKVSGLGPSHSAKHLKKCYQGFAQSKPWAAFTHTHHSPLPKGSTSGKKRPNIPHGSVLIRTWHHTPAVNTALPQH